MKLPIFRLDSREKTWRPVGVEESLEPFGYRWVHDGYGRPGWSVSGEGITSQLVDRLDFPQDMTQPHLPSVIYRRVVREENLWWNIYGLWWLYNPKTYGPGLGNHEGDWEFVVVGTTDIEGDRPVLVYGSTHESGVGRVVWKAERFDGRPVIYVAQGSHANYLGPVENVQDQADGKGLELFDYKVRAFGPWANWTGRWGNSHNSPGPLSTRLIWNRPSLAYSRAR